MLSLNESIFLIVGYGAVLLLIVYIVHLRKGTKISAFWVADRNVSTIRGSLSIAAAWIWAPAVFICFQKLKNKPLQEFFGLRRQIYYVFSFSLPLRPQKRIPYGILFPDYICHRYQSNALHIASLIIFVGYQFGGDHH